MTTRSHFRTRTAYRAVFSDFLRICGLADAVYRQRQGLARLDDHMLKDIGLSREEAQREARKPGWDVPNHWRR